MEPSELALPRRLQEWLIGHEVSHLHTIRKHRAKHFDDVEVRLIGPDHEERHLEYWGYRRQHESELRGFARRFMATKRRAPELTLVQKLERVNAHIKGLSRRIKRLNTALKKWERKKRALSPTLK